MLRANPHSVCWRTVLWVGDRPSCQRPTARKFADFSEAKFSVAILVEYNFYVPDFDKSLKCSFMFLVAEIEFHVRHNVEVCAGDHPEAHYSLAGNHTRLSPPSRAPCHRPHL